MPTKFNLTIDSQTDGMSSGSEGITQNTMIRSENPEELIAVLRKLSGLEEPQHTSQSITAAGAPAHSPEPAAPLEVGAASMGSCATSTPSVTAVVRPAGVHEEDQEETGSDEDKDEDEDKEGDDELAHLKRNMGNKKAVEEALANAPNPKTMKSLMDLVNTDHTARAPTKPVPAKSGDNPLVDEDETLLESKLMREWQETKLQHYAESLDSKKAATAIAEGKDSFVDGTREYAVRNQEGFIKVYPIIENRVMTQAPVYVVQESFKDVVETGDGRGVSPELSRDMRFTPDRLKDLDKPAAQRAGMKPVPHELKQPEFDRTGRRKIREEENGESMTDVFNRYKRHFAIMHDTTEERDQRQLSATECKDIVSDLQEKFPDEFNLIRDLKQYAMYQEKYDQTQDLRFQTNAQRLLSKYEGLTKSSKNDDYVSDKDSEDAGYYGPYDERTPALLRRQATEGVTEAKKKKAKNKYAIGMAAAMKATGDKPPLEKSTITKAHEIAKAVKEGSKKK